jgi:putative nucleotidyltransferase with HDIG domain
MTNILIVDDDESIRHLIRHILEPKGYTCILTADTAKARDCLKKQNFELILCDITMPGESGLDFIQDILPSQQDTATVMVTGTNDPIVAEAALELGVYDYIIKPFDPNKLLITVQNTLRRRDLEIANRTYRENLELMVAERTEKLEKALDGIVRATVKTVEMRDPYTAGHQKRVAELSSVIAREMGLSENQIEGIHMAGLIHDLGKISVPAEILSKPGQLTEIEFDLMKTHPQVGYDILNEIEFPWPIAQIVLQHHERMDGSGYPQGLCGEDILMEARILGVADIVEAMASHRPYRPALGIDKALQEISRNKGVLYDPEVVNACLRLFKEKDFKLN